MIADQKLDFSIDNDEYDEDSVADFTLKNDDGVLVYFDIGSTSDENGKLIDLIWSLPSGISSDKLNEFYHNELPKLFDLASTFYENSKKLKSGLKEFSEYYDRAEESFVGGLYWTKRIGNDHLLISIKPYSQDNRNRIGTLTVISGSSYENYLKLFNENWKKAASVDSIEISDSNVAEIMKIKPPVDNEDLYSKHFDISGHLEDVKEIKTVPESLKNIVSSFLKPNRDKYLMAKLVDDTGSVDVFLQATSLYKDELSMERNHNVVLYYYKNNPILIVRNSFLTE